MLASRPRSRNLNSRGISQQLVVPTREFLSAQSPPVNVVELDIENRGLQPVEAAVYSFDQVVALPAVSRK